MNTPVDVCETVTVREAAAKIGIKYVKCLELIKTRELHAKWIGNRYIVPLSAIKRYLDPEGDA